MNWFTGWRAARDRAAILDSLSRIEQQGKTIMSGLDDIKANETKLRALVEKLIGLVQSAAPGSFTPEQQATIDGIVADQQATLAEDPTPPATT